MPQTYHDFNPFRQAAHNIASGMIMVQRNRALQQQRQQQMAMEAPLREAQTRSANSTADLNTEKAAGEKQKNNQQGFVNDHMREVLGRMEAGTQPNADGTVTMTPDAQQAISGALAVLAKNANDFGGGVERATKGMNYTAEQDKNRANAADMNTERVAGANERQVNSMGAAMERLQTNLAAKKFSIRPNSILVDSEGEQVADNPQAATAHTSAGTNTLMQDAKQRKQRAHAAMLKLQETAGAPFEFMPAPQQKLYQSYRDEYKRADTDLNKFSTPAAAEPPLSDNSQTQPQIPLTNAPALMQGGDTPAATNAAPARIVRGPDGRLTWAQ